VPVVECDEAEDQEISSNETKSPVSEDKIHCSN
jgi:hypothetical protein